MKPDSGKLQPPLFVNVDYSSGNVLNHWVDSLSASFPGVQVGSVVVQFALFLDWLVCTA